MRLLKTTIALICVLAFAAASTADSTKTSGAHEVLKLEVGKWDAAVTMFMGPAGPYTPPHKSKAKETNRMIGNFWLVTDYRGSFEGAPYIAQGHFGYDAKQKKYVGTWIDSFSPNATKMVGTYDAEKKTMTYETSGVAPDGNPSKGKNIVVYGKNKKTMTMFVAAPGTEQLVKVMEITYTRQKK